MNPIDLRLYAILDGEHAGERDLPTLARAAATGGCTLLQYRDKTATTRVMIERARAVRAALEGTGVPLIVNDRIDVALAAGAEGVHVGRDDMHAADARRLLGPGAIIGITVKTTADADELYRLSVDYACIGGVFATASKINPDPPIGIDGLVRIAFRVRLAAGRVPVGAIAGIDRTNIAPVLGAGADGVAVLSALFGAEDVEASARELRRIVDEALAARGRVL